MVAVLALVFFFSVPAMAQNTKGDKPATNQGGPFLRIPRIKSKSKGGDRPNTRDISGRRRIRTKNKSSANRIIYQQPDPYKDRKRKKMIDRPAQARGRIFNKPPSERQRAWKGTRDGSPLRIRSVSAQRARHNVYPQSGPYVNNQSSLRKRASVYTRTAAGKPVIKRKPNNRQRAWKSTGGPVSASRSHVTRGRKNVYWGKFSKGERPLTRDLAGRLLRKLNFQSTPGGVGTTDTLRLFRRRPGRDRANSGRVTGGFVSASKRGERPWLGDVSGHKLRIRSRKKSETSGVWELKGHLGTPKRGRGHNKPLPPKAPGIGVGAIAKTLRRLRGERPFKGGGSATRSKPWNNNHNPIEVRFGRMWSNRSARFQGNFRKGELSSPGFGKQGIGYSGDIKAKRPLKGGGSVSGRVWNNNRRPLDVKAGAPGFDRGARFRGNFRRNELAPGYGRQGFGYAGDIKARKPVRGGGSISGKLFNNNGRPIESQVPGRYTAKAVRFSGTIKTRKPAKGGGSVSGKVFNNNGRPLNAKGGAPGFDRASRFTGNLKAKKPEKGGGSISGVVFNNKGRPINTPSPGLIENKAANYSGKIRLPRFKRDYIQNPNAAKESLKKQKPDPNMYLVADLQVKNKEKKYRKKPTAADGALPGIGPKQGTVKASEYDHAMKMYWSYKRNPNSSADALKGIKPAKGLSRVVEFSGRTRLSKSIRHNPSSDDEALKVFTPGKAYARINNYQGNMKMKKYNDRRLHPDAQFAHGSRDNVKEDRTILMNLKLFWAKLFKKNDGQPEIVKVKEHRPRYDRKEKDLWKALYD